MTSIQTIFDFHKETHTSAWRIVDDAVMGGKSNGEFSINNEGQGVFSGEISLENNGGFSSERNNFSAIDVTAKSKICITLKGDGKTYQFRIKEDSKNRHSYVSAFNTSGSWETVTIHLKELSPVFRGKTLDKPNFNCSKIEEIAFLIASNSASSFKLLIDCIYLE